MRATSARSWQPWCAAGAVGEHPPDRGRPVHRLAAVLAEVTGQQLGKLGLVLAQAGQQLERRAAGPHLAVARQAQADTAGLGLGAERDGGAHSSTSSSEPSASAGSM
jgi:hypothetical protein